MVISHRSFAVGAIMSILGIFGIYQTYYLFVPHNIAYKLKSEDKQLIAYHHEYQKDPYEKIGDWIMNNYNVNLQQFISLAPEFKSAKDKGLILCNDQKQTNWINWCRTLYSRPISDNESYEMANKWCALPDNK